MLFQRASDESWVKYLLGTGLVPVDQLQAMCGGQNQTDLTELLVRHADQFDTVTWLNQALQHDRFHYIPLHSVEAREIQALQQVQPVLVARCRQENILPLGYACQCLYLGLLRYDAEFPELKEILKTIPDDILVCQVPVAPKEFVRIRQQLIGLR